MARTKKPKSITWTKLLDETEVREAFEDAIIDAYDEYEQHSGLEAVRKLMSNKSITWKSLKAYQETDYPVSPFLALPCI